MRTKHIEGAIIALLACLALGCGGTIGSTGEADGENDTDTGDTGTDAVPDGEDPLPDPDPDADPDVVPDTDPDVDLDVVPDTEPDVPPDVDPDSADCPPGDIRCRDGNLETCPPDGAGWEVTICDLGCLDAPEPHCGEWSPSLVPEDLVTAGSGDLGPGNPAWDLDIVYVEMDADSGEIAVGTGSDYRLLREAGEGMDMDSGIHFEIVSQPGDAPDIGVFSFTGVEIPATATVWTVGDNAIALASSGDMVVEGVLNCKAYFDGSGNMYPGPGGHWPGEGPGSGGDGTEGSGTGDGGGGGAGYGGAGGDGGLVGSTGGAGGGTYGNPELVPLLGGSGGGEGADSPGDGGPGGGACVLISATSIAVESGGVVDAAGHGGEGAASRGGGGGAGSGGAILVESPIIEIAGLVVANGGGGGSGAVSPYDPGTDGERGHAGLDAALGGVNADPGSLGCAGGNGNAADAVDGLDNACDSDDEDGGGGGGGSGRIRLNGTTVSPGTDTLSPSLATPACTIGPLPVV